MCIVDHFKSEMYVSNTLRTCVRMVWAMAMPTLPAPMTEILVWRLVGEGGEVLRMGLKKAWAMSRPPGPRFIDELLFCIDINVCTAGYSLSFSISICSFLGVLCREGMGGFGG